MKFFWGAKICSQFDTLEIFWDLVSQIPSPSNWDSFDDYWNWSWWCHHVWWPIASGQPGPSRWNRCRFQNGDTGKCWWKLDELWRDVYNLYNILSMWWNDNKNSTYTSQSWLQHTYMCVWLWSMILISAWCFSSPYNWYHCEVPNIIIVNALLPEIDMLKTWKSAKV